MLFPPFNVAKDGSGRGCLEGLCVDDDGLYVSSSYGPARILRLPRVLKPIVEPKVRETPPEEIEYAVPNVAPLQLQPEAPVVVT